MVPQPPWVSLSLGVGSDSRAVWKWRQVSRRVAQATAQWPPREHKDWMDVICDEFRGVQTIFCKVFVCSWVPKGFVLLVSGEFFVFCQTSEDPTGRDLPGC